MFRSPLRVVAGCSALLPSRAAVALRAEKHVEMDTAKACACASKAKQSSRFLRWLLSTVILVSTPSAVLGQMSEPVSAARKDDRFSINIKNVPVYEETGLMTKFDINVQWWTLLGEPIEYYDIRWFSSGKYEIDGRWIYRDDLEKYPDLLKRFDNLRPKLSIRLAGSADGGTVSARRGHTPTSHGFGATHAGYFKRKGKAYDRYNLEANFVYVVPDRKLLTTRAGKVGDGIVPGSPHWNEFLYWQTGSSPYSHWRHDAVYETGSKSDERLEKRNRTLFEKTNEITLSAAIDELEWPRAELKAIAEKFDRYEAGEEEPSPLERVAAAQEEAQALEAYEEDDFWSTPEMAADPKLAVFEEDGRYGVVDQNTGVVILRPEYDSSSDLAVVAGRYVVVPAGDSESVVSCRDGTRLSTNHYKLLDHTGDVVADAFSTHTMVEDQIRIERVTSCTESSLTRHIAQREWVLYDADLVEQDRGTETREWELDIDLGRPLLKAY